MFFLQVENDITLDLALKIYHVSYLTSKILIYENGILDSLDVASSSHVLTLPHKQSRSVLEYLDKGIIDFGLLFREIDKQKYESIPVPIKDTWGVLMHKDSPLAIKESIQPQDLWDKPLIVPHQKGDDVFLNQWLQRDESQLHIAATYNLIFNASLLVDEGLGYALCYDKLINTKDSNLCFRPLYPRLEVKGYIVWKKYQVFSKAAELFLQYLRKILENKI